MTGGVFKLGEAPVGLLKIKSLLRLALFVAVTVIVFCPLQLRLLVFNCKEVVLPTTEKPVDGSAAWLIFQPNPVKGDFPRAVALRVSEKFEHAMVLSACEVRVRSNRGFWGRIVSL